MKFYRAVWKDDEPTAANCEWFTNKRDAEREASANWRGNVLEMDVPTTKAGLLEFLNERCWRYP
jgi:hypothetical protein